MPAAMCACDSWMASIQPRLFVVALERAHIIRRRRRDHGIVHCVQRHGAVNMGFRVRPTDSDLDRAVVRCQT